MKNFNLGQVLRAYEESESRKKKAAVGIVNHIYLAGVETRLQLGKRNAELEHGRMTVAIV